MKTKINAILMLFSCFVLTSCGSTDSGSSSGDDSSKKNHFEQALESFSKYDLHLTNGFDYSIKQYYGSEIVNSKSIKLRVKFENGTEAKKTTNTKKINEFGQGEQYSFAETVTYFKNNQICEFDDGIWSWRAFDESEYLKTNLSAFSVDKQYFTNVSETSVQSDLKFTANVPSNYISSVLGNDTAGINQLQFTLVVKNDYSMLKSLSFTYNQQNTNSEISFVSVFDSGTIDFPS